LHVSPLLAPPSLPSSSSSVLPTWSLGGAGAGAGGGREGGREGEREGGLLLDDFDVDAAIVQGLMLPTDEEDEEEDEEGREGGRGFLFRKAVPSSFAGLE